MNEPVCATCGGKIQATVESKVWLTLESDGWEFFDRADPEGVVELYCVDDHAGDQLGLNDEVRENLVTRALAVAALLPLTGNEIVML